MNLDSIKKTDLSLTTSKFVKERVKWLRKAKNSVFKSAQKTKDGFKLLFSSSATKRDDQYQIIVEKKDKDFFIYCSCEGFHKQGMMYRATKLNASVFQENRPDKRWSAYHSPKSILCKHLWILFNKQKPYLDSIVRRQENAIQNSKKQK